MSAAGKACLMPTVYELDPDPIAAERPSPRRGLDRKTSIKFIRIGVVGLALLSVLVLYWILTEPYRVAARFVQAVETRDYQTMLRLGDPRERPASLGALTACLRRLLPEEVRWDGDHGDSRWYTRNGMGQFERYVFWRTASTGQRIPGKWGSRRPQLRSAVMVHKTAAGWRVNLSMFILHTCQTRWGTGEFRQPFRQLMREAGLSCWYDDMGDQHQL